MKINILRISTETFESCSRQIHIIGPQEWHEWHCIQTQRGQIVIGCWTFIFLALKYLKPILQLKDWLFLKCVATLHICKSPFRSLTHWPNNWMTDSHFILNNFKCLHAPKKVRIETLLPIEMTSCIFPFYGWLAWLDDIYPDNAAARLELKCKYLKTFLA